MFMLATHVVATYSGMSFTEFVKTRIFTPANMTVSTYSVAEASIGGRLTQSWTKSGRRIPIWFEHDGTEIMAGPGSMMSNVVDMTNWLKVLIHSGVHPLFNRTVLPLNTFVTTTTTYAIVNGRGMMPGYSIEGYGLGWFRFSYNGHEIVYHTGGLPGCTAIVAFLPADGFGIVAFMNKDEKGLEALWILTKAVDEVFKTRKDESAISGPTIFLPASTSENMSGSKATLSLDIEKYEGTYANPAYGTVTLCSTTNPTAYCKGVLFDFAPFEVFTNTSAPPTLFASFRSFWCSHLRFIHLTADTFAMPLTTLFPGGYGRDTSPFEVLPTTFNYGQATFVVEEGQVVGFGTADLLLERGRSNGSVKDTADAWFEKV